MKRNYLFKNTGRITAVIALLGVTLLSSCLKDTSPGAINFADSPPLVSFQYYGFSQQELTTSIHGTPNDTSSVEIALSVASIEYSKPVTVTIAHDADAEAAQAAADKAAGTTDVIVPSTEYSLDNGGVVTFNPGQHLIHLGIKFKGNLIDFSQNNILALKIASVSPSNVVIATNLNVAVLVIGLESIYQGTYSYKGFDVRIVGGVPDMTFGGHFHGDSQFLPTLSAYQVGLTPLWANDTDIGGVAGTFITVDPATNAVTMAATGNATLTNMAGYDNRYDPATKTFYLSFTWSTPGTRESTDTLTYTGP